MGPSLIWSRYRLSEGETNTDGHPSQNKEKLGEPDKGECGDGKEKENIFPHELPS